MKLSIRSRILAGVVLVNILGAAVTVVYLHQTYSGGLDVTAQRAVDQSLASWTVLNTHAAEEFGDVTTPEGALQYAEAIKKICVADVGVMISKDRIDKETYLAAREAAGLPGNWDEAGDQYVLVANTNDKLANEFVFAVPAADVPEIGKPVGIRNGACAKTCHGSLSKKGDYWGVAWGDTGVSEAHAVAPIMNSKGEAVGVLYTITDISPQADSAKDSMIRTLAVIAITLLIATVIIGGLLDTLIFRRLGRMITSIEEISVRLAGGDFDAHFSSDGSDDEIGEFEKFFEKFMELISGTLKALTGGK